MSIQHILVNSSSWFDDEEKKSGARVGHSEGGKSFLLHQFCDFFS
jgi:hypothetical protein